MRITNKIMQRNNLSNINTNKLYQDRLSNQMSSQKKITRPSDDPVVAIRALRLRSNVTEITQYYSKNIPDAASWLKVTEDAISNLSQIITNMIARCNKGVNNYLTTEDRSIILKEMKSLAESVYSTGDADYAGRYVFTGYRTDTSLSFLYAKEQEYTITEQLDSSAIDTVTKVETSGLLDINANNYANADMAGIDEDSISSVEAYRIRLAYNDCAYDSGWDEYLAEQNELVETLNKYRDAINEELETISQAAGQDPAKSLDDIDFRNMLTVDSDLRQAIDAVKNSEPAAVADLADWDTNWAANEAKRVNLTTPQIQYTDTAGNIQTWGGDQGNMIVMHSYENPYAYASAHEDCLVYVPETGELLLGADRYETLMGTKDRENTPNLNEAEIRVTYPKSNWQKGDLRPEHYFYCEAAITDAQGNPATIKYNESYIDPKLAAEHQIIEYDVGYNQTIRINSTADECFKHGIGREVDDIVNAMQDVLDLEGAEIDINNIIKTLEADPTMDIDDKNKKMAILQNQLDAVKKALVLAKEKEQKLFAGGITELQKYLDDANLCVTDCGARESKLELIKNRTQNQKTTYETLKSENEDIDITEVAIELSAAELTYDAALMAAGKVMQNTLLNFI